MLVIAATNGDDGSGFTAFFLFLFVFLGALGRNEEIDQSEHDCEHDENHVEEQEHHRVVYHGKHECGSYVFFVNAENGSVRSQNSDAGVVDEGHPFGVDVFHGAERHGDGTVFIETHDADAVARKDVRRLLDYGAFVEFQPANVVGKHGAVLAAHADYSVVFSCIGEENGGYDAHCESQNYAYHKGNENYFCQRRVFDAVSHGHIFGIFLVGFIFALSHMPHPVGIPK